MPQLIRHSKAIIMQASLSQCAQEVKKHDHDQFLCGLFCPDGVHDAYYAIHMFYLETARIRDLVKEAHLGHFRLQYWRDLIENIYQDQDGQAENGLHKEIVEAVKQKKIDKALFERYFNARSFDMEDRAHDDLAALLRYCEATGGICAQMKAALCGVANSQASIKIGAALTLVGLIRTLPYQSRSGQCKIPHALVKKHELDLKAFMNFKNSNALSACVKELADAVLSLIDEARSFKEEVNPVLLSSVGIEDYLKRLSKVGYDPFNPNIGGGRLSRQLKISYRAFRGRY